MIYTHAAAMLLGAAIAGAGAWNVQAWRYDARELARVQSQAEAFRKAESIANAASTGHEQDKANDQARIRTIRKTVEKIVERPRYAAACLDDDGMRALTIAIKPGDAAAKPGNALP